MEHCSIQSQGIKHSVVGNATTCHIVLFVNKIKTFLKEIACAVALNKKTAASWLAAVVA